MMERAQEKKVNKRREKNKKVLSRRFAADVMRRRREN